MKRIVWVDIDGTIGDSGPDFLKYAQRIDPRVKRLTSYDLMQFGVSRKIMKEFLNSEEYAEDIKNLRPIVGAIEGINELYDLGYIINFLTARNAYNGIKEDTLAWLEKQGVRHNDLIFDEEKLLIIGENSKNPMIEDSPYEIGSLSGHGVPCICVKRDYNPTVEDSKLVKRLSWIEAKTNKETVTEYIQREFPLAA
jgi:hypothetical protein